MTDKIDKLDLFILREFSLENPLGLTPETRQQVSKELFPEAHKAMADQASANTQVNVLTVIAVVSAVSFAAVQIYKRYFSEAAKSCKSKSGEERTDCINNYKRKGTTAYNQVIRNGISKCDKSKDPKKCKQLLKDKMKNK